MALTNHPAYLITALSLILYLSYLLNKKPVFRTFGIALMAIVLGAVFSNLGIIPSASNATYDAVFNLIAPAALFLMLLDANLMQLKRTGVPILVLFLAGSLGTVLGVLTATYFIGDSQLFAGMYRPLAGMFAGTYTGGSINFNAVALEYEVMENGLVYTSAVAVDNVITTLWFFITVALPVLLNRLLPIEPGRKEGGAAKEADSPETGNHDESARLSLGSLSLWVAFAGAGLLATDTITSWLQDQGWKVPSMIVLTTLALILAQVPAIHRYKGNMFLGSWAVYLFLAVVGAFCDFSAIAEAGQLAILLLVLVLVTVLIHGLVIFGTAALLRYDWYLAAIASQANIGGGTSAMALAKNFGRNQLILPSIIIGTLGNALGTYLGFLVVGLT